MQSEYWKRAIANARSELSAAYGATVYRITNGGASREDAATAAEAIRKAQDAVAEAQRIVADIDLGYN